MRKILLFGLAFLALAASAGPQAVLTVIHSGTEGGQVKITSASAGTIGPVTPRKGKKPAVQQSVVAPVTDGRQTLKASARLDGAGDRSLLEIILCGGEETVNNRQKYYWIEISSVKVNGRERVSQIRESKRLSNGSIADIITLPVPEDGLVEIECVYTKPDDAKAAAATRKMKAEALQRRRQAAAAPKPEAEKRHAFLAVNHLGAPDGGVKITSASVGAVQPASSRKDRKGEIIHCQSVSIVRGEGDITLHLEAELTGLTEDSVAELVLSGARETLSNGRTVDTWIQIKSFKINGEEVLDQIRESKRLTTSSIADVVNAAIPEDGKLKIDCVFAAPAAAAEKTAQEQLNASRKKK